MEEAHRRILQRNAVRLVRDLHIDEDFLAIFEEEKIFTSSMMEEIEVKPTSSAKTREFMKILPKRGKNAFRVFIDALMETEQKEIAESLAPDLASIWQSQRLGSIPANCHPGSTMQPRARVIQDQGNSLVEIDVLDADRNLVQQVLRNDNEAYMMKSRPRGRAVILNNEFFTNKSAREGSVFDAVNLDQLYTRLGFQTQTWTNESSEDLMKKVQEERTNPAHAQADAFIFTILSHGNRGNIYGSDGKAVELDRIFAMFDGNSCPDLVGKPKIFIIQACQGNLQTSGVVRSDGGGEEGDSEMVHEESNIPVPAAQLGNRDTQATIPIVHEKADFVLAYSTVPGYRSWRNTEEGTWFIRDLIYTFMERCHSEHLLDMLLEVNRKQDQRVALQRQISETRYSTRKKIYFLPGYYESSASASQCVMTL